MATYSDISLEEIEVLLGDYDLGDVLAAAPLKGGQANSSFQLRTSRGRFVLSICDEKSMAEVRGLASVLDQLARHQFPTTRVVAARSGARTTTFRGKPVLIKAFIGGSVPEILTTGMVAQIGRQIARLHAIPAPEGVPTHFAYGTDRFDEVIASSADPAYRRWLADKKAYLEQAERSDLPRALIHGDLFHDNTLFEGERLTAILDFEEACRFLRVFDLGMCAVGVCAENGLIVMDKVRALVAGYAAHGVLTDSERERLQAFIVYGATATSFWRFRQYNLILPGHPEAARYREMNHIANQVQAISSDTFQRAVF